MKTALLSKKRLLRNLSKQTESYLEIRRMRDTHYAEELEKYRSLSATKRKDYRRQLNEENRVRMEQGFKPKRSPPDMADHVVEALAASIMTGLALGSLYLFVRGVRWGVSAGSGVVGQYVPVEAFQLVVVVVVFALGSGLYWLRCSYTRAYGFLEIAVGIVLAGYAANQAMELTLNLKDAGVYFTIAGALYIIVRGYDNVYRSLKWGSPLLKLMNRVFHRRPVFRRL